MDDSPGDYHIPILTSCIATVPEESQSLHLPHFRIKEQRSGY